MSKPKRNAVGYQLKESYNRLEPHLPLDEKALNRDFASVAAYCLDYLICTYYKPLEFDFTRPVDPYKLAERNGQQLMLVDILTRVDMGKHPMAYEPDFETEEPLDVRS